MVSAKSWGDVLVLRDVFKLDNHPGWHSVLGGIHRFTAWNTHSLVLFSVIALFLLFVAAPLLYLRRPEAWILALLVLHVTTGFTFRLLLGRPYIVSMAAIMLICSLWKGLERGRRPYVTFIAITFAIALSTWIHAGWYLFALPLIAFLVSRKWRVSILYSIASFSGILIGALLTGHPYQFLKQNFIHFFIVLGNHTYVRMLATELQPFNGDIIIVMIVCFFLLWRYARRRWSHHAIDNPVFILAALCWPLGFLASRTWSDIGLVAIGCFMYSEFEDFISIHFSPESIKRIIFTLIALGVYFIAVTSDVGSRWSGTRPFPYLSMDNPKHSKLLPGRGGIIYSDNMLVFFSTFYKNPNAPWKYILGFESTMMPAEDLATFRNIQLTFGSPESYKPWVDKMRPEDRMIIGGAFNNAPEIKGLLWDSPGTGVWIGHVDSKKGAGS